MCGICGFSWEDKALLQKMMKVIAHRGPDDSGFLCDKNVSLGHQRLSIIDLSEKGRNPMFNEDNSLCIIYNGEIYNFKEIRQGLEQKGHRFISDTDTEVIVHAYEEYGEEFINYFNGMFAFAIYDFTKKAFLLVRDRAGVKPLYYALVDNNLIFASEIKSILQHPLERKINHEAFHNFLTFRYIPGQETIFKGISKLQPGHMLLFKNGKASIKKYWDIEISPDNKPEAYYLEQFNNLIKNSVNMRLISDVPLGAYLSGGLDSSFIVSLMSRMVKEPVKTFSVGFGYNKEIDETRYARIVAEEFHTDHHELVIDSSAVKILPKLLWHMDEPIADAAAIPNYYLSEFTKKYVTVVLTGEGADELFAGYRKYKYMLLFDYYNRIFPKFLKKLSSKAVSLNKDDLYKRISCYLSSRNLEEAYLNLISFFTNAEKKDLLQKGFQIDKKPDIKFVEYYFAKQKNLLDKMLLLDFKTWLPEDILIKVDKTSMASSVESREPFLDRNVIELCAKIPPSLKLKNFKEKYLFRKAIKDYVPKQIYQRKKHGFNVPIDRWLDKELKELTSQVLSETNLKNRPYNFLYIKKILEKYNNSKSYYSRQIWLLLNFEIWNKIFIEGDISKPNFNINKLF